MPDKENEWVGSGNIISDLTNKKVTSVPFGGNISELNFDVNEFNRIYNSPEVLRAAEQSRQNTNIARAKNGLKPI